MTGIVFIAAIVLIWFVVRTVRQGEAIRHLHERQAAEQMRPRPTISATDTIACAHCGAYVPSDHRIACSRTDCPFPRAG